MTSFRAKLRRVVEKVLQGSTELCSDSRQRQYMRNLTGMEVKQDVLMRKHIDATGETSQEQFWLPVQPRGEFLHIIYRYNVDHQSDSQKTSKILLPSNAQVLKVMSHGMPKTVSRLNG